MSFTIKKLAIVLLLTLTLQAQTGLTQKYLVSISPETGAQDISADTSIEIEYNLILSKDSVSKRAIVLKNAKHKKIQGQVSIKNNTTLIFTPNEELVSGEYKVKVKQIKLQDYTRNTRSVRYAKKFCSYFYDDIKECRLYNYATRVKSKKIKYSFNVDDGKPKVISLSLNKSNIQLNENNTTTISVNAKYDDNTTLDVTNDVEWILSNSNIVSIDKNIITPLSEGTTSLQAKFKNQTTIEISLTVYKEINGYKLPPEPDETLNNSTLLGIDVNDNGVRDDVERWIYEKYEDKHPVHIDIAMQEGKANKKILETPDKAREIHDEVDRAVHCQSYYKYYAKYFNESILLKDSVANEYFRSKIYFNTQERMDAYLQYDKLLSGGVYTLPKLGERKVKCDFNTSKYGK